MWAQSWWLSRAEQGQQGHLLEMQRARAEPRLGAFLQPCSQRGPAFPVEGGSRPGLVKTSMLSCSWKPHTPVAMLWWPLQDSLGQAEGRSRPPGAATRDGLQGKHFPTCGPAGDPRPRTSMKQSVTPEDATRGFWNHTCCVCASREWELFLGVAMSSLDS